MSRRGIERRVRGAPARAHDTPSRHRARTFRRDPRRLRRRRRHSTDASWLIVNSGAQLEARRGELIGAARFAVDHAHDRAEHRAAVRAARGGVEHRAARRDDVFDDAQPHAVDVAAFGELTGAVGLRLPCGRTGPAPVTCDSIVASGTPPSSRPASASMSVGTERRQALARSPSKAGIGLEAVLVEVLVARRARAQGERAGEMGRGVDPRARAPSGAIGAAAIGGDRTVDRDSAVAYRPACGGGGHRAGLRRWLGMTGPGGPVIPPPPRFPSGACCVGEAAHRDDLVGRACWSSSALSSAATRRSARRAPARGTGLRERPWRARGRERCSGRATHARRGPGMRGQVSST